MKYSRGQKFKTTLLKINIFMKCCVMIHNHRKHVINFIVVEKSFILDYVQSKIVIQQVQEDIFLRVLGFIKSLKMGRKSSLTEVQRARIVLLNQEDYSEQISKVEKCSKTAVHNALAKFKNSGSYSDNKRYGRPRKTTARDDHLIRRVAVRSPRSSSKKMRSALLAHSTDVSSKTVKRRLTKDFGLKTFKPAKKPHLTPAMKLKRLNFAKKHINWSREQWSRVIFSDESCIQQFGSRKHSVWRPVGKRFDEKYTQQTMKYSPKIMIWGAMSVKGTAGLFCLTPGTTMNGAKYLELLKNKLQLHMNVHECTIFMQDGAPCHKAKIVSNFLKSKKIQVLDWPGNSPDLNPIENL